MPKKHTHDQSVSERQVPEALFKLPLARQEGAMAGCRIRNPELPPDILPRDFSGVGLLRGGLTYSKRVGA